MEFIKKFQEGGAMPQDPNAAAGAPQGGEDPTAMLMQGAQQAVQLLALVGFLHIFYFIDIVIANDFHHLERLPFCSQNRTATGQNPRKVIRLITITAIVRIKIGRAHV